MCGIVGVVSRSPVPVETIQSMRDTMRHRGPDDEGYWRSSDGRVALGHRRLSVIDLSADGRQPMSDADGRLVLSFNGEIYNYVELRDELEGKGHRFRTSSDSEVVLEAFRAWGEQCLKRFDGMFALSIFDRESSSLFLARDRVGEKPLFYFHDDHSFAFASELKALMANAAFPRRLDTDALCQYLTYGYVPQDGCMLQGYRKLRPGHAMSYNCNSGRIKVWRYWQCPAYCGPGDAAVNELVTELEALLLKSVRRRLVADVPVGIMLSGGLDSSLVTAMSVQASSTRVKTFNVAFSGHDSFDEAPFARAIAGYFDTDHTEVVADQVDVGLLPRLVQQVDEPIADLSILPTFLVSQALRQHATVALGGDGGDELFGGYHHYSRIQKQASIRRWTPSGVRTLAAFAAAKILPVGFRGRNFLMGLERDTSWSIAQTNILFDQIPRSRLLAPVYDDERVPSSNPEEFKASLYQNEGTALRQATSADFTTYLPDYVLTKVDRASMLNSLEVRAPFLDPRVIEFAFGRLPDTLRCKGHQKKVLLQHLGRKLLPPGFRVDRKQGFGVPIDSWFHGEWGNFMVEVLTQATPELFSQDAITELIRRQRQGARNGLRLFAITVFELWRRHYDVSI